MPIIIMITSAVISKIRVSSVFWYLHIAFCHLMIAPWHIRCVMLVNRFVNAHTHTPAILAPLTFSTNNKMKWANICACHNTCMMKLIVSERLSKTLHYTRAKRLHQRNLMAHQHNRKTTYFSWFSRLNNFHSIRTIRTI